MHCGTWLLLASAIYNTQQWHREGMWLLTLRRLHLQICRHFLFLYLQNSARGSTVRCLQVTQPVRYRDAAHLWHVAQRSTRLITSKCLSHNIGNLLLSTLFRGGSVIDGLLLINIAIMLAKHLTPHVVTSIETGREQN